MKVQITAKVETYVTMEVEVPDTNEETLENAMNEILADTEYSYDHESIVETEMVGQEMSSHTSIGKEPLPDKYHFYCSNCDKVHKMGLYAVAQLTFGNSLNFTGCECGVSTYLEPKMIKEN